MEAALGRESADDDPALRRGPDTDARTQQAGGERDLFRLTKVDGQRADAETVWHRVPPHSAATFRAAFERCLPAALLSNLNKSLYRRTLAVSTGDATFQWALEQHLVARHKA
jgi:hypothetical protein